ncbi:programmed cell death protein [Boothiomyces sp. JEL0838]|nr:programmed cell death protein [Boothiomyces sp. JEL0838]
MQVGFVGSSTNEDVDKIGGEPYVKVTKAEPLFKVESWSDSEDDTPDITNQSKEITMNQTSYKTIELDLFETDSKFPCFELYFENETKAKESYTYEQKLLEEYLKNNPQDEQILNGKVEEGEWKEDYEPADLSMKLFKKFTKTIQFNPTQVMRYEYKGKPLYYKHLENIPDCPCGAKRVFEFQIMPYVLTIIQKIDQVQDFIDNGLDFGTILVFVCEKDCDNQTEFAVVQSD